MQALDDSGMLECMRGRVYRLHPNLPPLWGKMSAPQMIVHLTDSFRLSLGEKQASPATGVFQRTLIKWVALYAPMQWPVGIRTRPEVEQGAGGTPPGDWDQDRAALIEVMNRFLGVAQHSAHPFFGYMSRRQWMRWGFLHADHHLRQFGV